MKSIYSIAQDTATKYRNESGRNEVVEGLNFHMYETVREAEFLSSGHYQTGDFDENGDLKPFHDICTRLLENQRSAEEVDTSDLVISTDDSDYYTRAMLITKYNNDWMAKIRMGKFLNEAIEARGKYGGLLVKVVEVDDEIDLQVVDWNSFNGDPQDLKTGIKVINHFYTPSQLIAEAQERGWDMEMVDAAIELYSDDNMSDNHREQKETYGDYILVREITGDLPTYLLDENADEHEYSHQLHYIAGAEFKDTDDAGEEMERGVTLFADELEKSPYYYLPYKKRGGNERMLGIGVVERAKHAQVQTNRAAQQWKRSMDFASTHVLQSGSKNLKGKNVLSNMKPGSIIKIDPGAPISGVDMSPQALQHLDRYVQSWQNQVDRATGTYSVSTGEDLPSGTPYRLGAILDQNAQSAFDLRREEFDIFLNQIYTERVIPWMIKQLKRKSVLKLAFTPDELKKLDADVEEYKADQVIIEKYLNGEYNDAGPLMKFVRMDEDKAGIMMGLDKQLKRQKNRRTITDFPKGYWDQVADKLYISITNERRKKGAVLETVNNVLMQYLQYKPQLDQDPAARALFNDIVEVAGLDPIDWTQSEQSQQQPQAPQGQPHKKSDINKTEELTAKPN